MIHLEGKLQNASGALQVHFDGIFQWFVESDGGCRMENDADAVAQSFAITFRYAQILEHNIARNWRQFFQTFSMFFTQQLKNLLR